MRTVILANLSSHEALSVAVGDDGSCKLQLVNRYKRNTVLDNNISPENLAIAAFRILGLVKDRLPDATLERLFEQEIGPLP